MKTNRKRGGLMLPVLAGIIASILIFTDASTIVIKVDLPFMFDKSGLPADNTNGNTVLPPVNTNGNPGLPTGNTNGITILRPRILGLPAKLTIRDLLLDYNDPYGHLSIFPGNPNEGPGLLSGNSNGNTVLPTGNLSGDPALLWAASMELSVDRVLRVIRAIKGILARLVPQAQQVPKA